MSTGEESVTGEAVAQVQLKPVDQVQRSRSKLLSQLQQEMSSMVTQKYESEWVPCTLWHHRDVRQRYPSLATLPELHKHLQAGDVQEVVATPPHLLADRITEVATMLETKRDELDLLRSQLAGTCSCV